MDHRKTDRVLIIANGQIMNKMVLVDYAQKADCIIAANGGSTICFENKIYPHFIVGDLDSIDKNVCDYFKEAEVVHIHDQNRHDMDKAVGFACTLNPKKIYILGAFGKRLDHSLANLVFIQSHKFSIPITCIDDYGQLSYIRGNYDLGLPPGRTVSLFSFLPVLGLSLEGFAYPLKKADFPNGFNGLSNITNSVKSRISIKKGSLFIYRLHENTPA